MATPQEQTDLGFRRTEADGILTITFVRDRKLNAVSPEMLDGVRAAVADLGDRDDIRVLVIAAEGRYFTAGLDISTQGGQGVGPDGSVSGRRLRRDYRQLHLLFDEIEAIEKPTVLAAHGPCMGVGVEMASSCDFRLASDLATFSLPEIPNLGVIPGSGGISRLTRLVGPHWAKWISVAAMPVDAQQALTIGFVHAVYPAAEFSDRVTEFAQRLASLPQEATALGKLAVDVAASADRVTARDFDRVANTLLITSDDYKQMVSDFNARSQARARQKSDGEPSA